MINLRDIPEWRRAFDEVGEDGIAAMAEHVLKQVDEREQAAERHELLQLGVAAKQRLRELFDYFDGDVSPNIRDWPGEALRTLAMTATVHAAQGLLGVAVVDLEQAISCHPPYQPWSWWFALGEALRTQQPTEQISKAFGISAKTVERKARFLLGPVGKGVRRLKEVA